MRYKRIKQFCAETGYTEEAVRGKIRSGIWQEGREYRNPHYGAPIGRFKASVTKP